MTEPSNREGELLLKLKFLKGTLGLLGSRGPIQSKEEKVKFLHSAARLING